MLPIVTAQTCGTNCLAQFVVNQIPGCINRALFGLDERNFQQLRGAIVRYAGGLAEVGGDGADLFVKQADDFNQPVWRHTGDNFPFWGMRF